MEKDLKELRAEIRGLRTQTTSDFQFTAIAMNEMGQTFQKTTSELARTTADLAKTMSELAKRVDGLGRELEERCNQIAGRRRLQEQRFDQILPDVDRSLELVQPAA